MKTSGDPQQTSANRQAYLMRLWRENEDAPWRVMLQSVNEGERQNFPTIDAFLFHLQAEYKRHQRKG